EAEGHSWRTNMTTYCNRAGRAVMADEALDASGLLRDGYGVRVPLQMCDGLQRDVASYFDGKRRRKTVARDPLGREMATYEEEEEPRRRRRHEDAATGFTDSRGVFFADARMVAAQDALDHLQGREEALRQIWRDGRAAAEQARQDMIDAGSAWRPDPMPTGFS